MRDHNRFALTVYLINGVTLTNVIYVLQTASSANHMTFVHNVKKDIIFLMDFVDNALKDARNALIQLVNSASSWKLTINALIAIA